MSTQQAQPLRAAGVVLTQEVIDKNRWYAFWDAPLVLPDSPEMAELRAYTAPRAAIDPVSRRAERRRPPSEDRWVRDSDPDRPGACTRARSGADDV